MKTNQQLSQLFQAYRHLEKPPVLILQNKQKLPVGALYLSQMACQHLIVNESDNWQINGSQRYYVVIDGKVGIFFTTFRKSVN